VIEYRPGSDTVYRLRLITTILAAKACPSRVADRTVCLAMGNRQHTG
jgi:hypothetical protein